MRHSKIGLKVVRVTVLKRRKALFDSSLASSKGWLVSVYYVGAYELAASVNAYFSNL
jgi:hypothetical protein